MLGGVQHSIVLCLAFLCLGLLLAAKGRLSSSPNEPQVLAHSNKVLIDLQKGLQCGCQLLGTFSEAKPPPTPAVASTSTPTGTGAPRPLASGVSNSNSNSNSSSKSSGVSIARGLRSRGAPVGGEERQWQELCLRGALAYLETAGAEEGAGRQPL